MSYLGDMGLCRTHGGVVDFIYTVRKVKHLVAVNGNVRTDSPCNRTFKDTCVELDIESLVLDLGITEVGGSGCRT